MRVRKRAARATHAATSGDALSTTFRRPLSGRNFAGMLAHVLRPMMTALRAPARVVAVVTRAKYARSGGSVHGSAPPAPMPHDGVAATMRSHTRSAGAGAGAGGAGDDIARARRMQTVWGARAPEAAAARARAHRAHAALRAHDRASC